MRIRGWRGVVAAGILSFSTAAVLAADAASPPSPTIPTCAQLPFVFNDFWTTQYGPAKADILTQPVKGNTEMVACPQSGVEYALCYYSGPPSSVTGNPPLPCKVVERDGKQVALCECYALTTSATSPYYVDINGILNTCVYVETVRTCEHDGSDCGSSNTPPVCSYVADNTLMPGADLVSTYSLAKASAYGGANACTSCRGKYAGCMTAPCKRVPGKDTVVCECPIAVGEYQVGQNGVNCDLQDGYVWSAANNVTTEESACPSGMFYPGTAKPR